MVLRATHESGERSKAVDDGLANVAGGWFEAAIHPALCTSRVVICQQCFEPRSFTLFFVGNFQLQTFALLGWEIIRWSRKHPSERGRQNMFAR